MTTAAPPRPFVIERTPIENPKYPQKYRADGTPIPSLRDKVRAALAYFRDNDQPAQEALLAIAYIEKTFPQYHGKNPQAIAFQCLERGIDVTTLTDLRGHKAWQDAGRSVHGAEAFAIRVPLVDRHTDEESEEMHGCMPAAIFDISQTQLIETGAQQDLFDATEIETAAKMTRMTTTPGTSTPQPPSLVPGTQIATKLRALADSMQKEIDYKLRPMTQNPTRKRNTEYDQRCKEGHRMERAQTALRLLADGHAQGTLPNLLQGLRSKKMVDQCLNYANWSWCDQAPFVRVGICGDPEYTEAHTALVALVGDVGRPTPAQLADQKLRKLALDGIPGWINTPSDLALRLVGIADIHAGQRVLEPGAGAGHIVDAILTLHPSCSVDVCEMNYSLREILQLKNYHLIGSDVFDLHEPVYDHIIANFPFENDVDIDMTYHCFNNLLAPGGRLVAIVGWMNHDPDTGALRPATKNNKNKAFVQWLIDHQADVEILPNGTFAHSLRPVQNGATLIVVDKDE